jgi:predicted regulator of amino acid metabolism with ACT domain
MWRMIALYFNKYPKQRIVAQKFLEYGLRIYHQRIYCGAIELADAKISRAFTVDRRIIADTIETITKNEELLRVFSRLKPTCHLQDVAPEMKWGVIEIIPTDPKTPGILARVSTLVADAGISIRQAIVDDFELSEEPRLLIIAEKQIPGRLIPRIRQVDGVKAVLIY